jgi:hypothetical protein
MAPPDRRLHDEDWRIAQAIAIRDGRFLAVGDDAAIAAHIGPNTQVVELAGKTVVPGLIDFHLHQLSAGLNGPAVQLLGFEAVSSGLADMYHASEITWAGRSAAFSYFCNVPFGFTPNEINAWIYHDGGQALWARLASRPHVQLGSTVPSVTSASVPGTRCSFIRPTGLEAAPGDLDNQALRHRVVATEDRPAEQNQAHHPTRGRT